MDDPKMKSIKIEMGSFYRDSINLTFNDISYKVPGKNKKEDKIILNNVSGTFYAGRLTAILGPSGAGKTSLLNILAGNNRRNVTGQILVNGEALNIDDFHWQSSYIAQESSLLPHLSQEETLMTAANLKLSNTTDDEKSLIIKNISNLLGLKNTMNTRVTQLSGGELKRLSIGVELVTNPPIMFFDEPTSGLDSVSAYQVITHLRKLAGNGHTIVCVIHQPSSRLFKMFDDFLLISNGRSIYNGPISHMVEDFETAGFMYPQYYNRADFAVEVASGDLEGDVDSLININTSKLQEHVESSNENKNNGNSFYSPTYKSIPANEKYNISPSNKATYKLSKRNNYATSQAKQFQILLKRSLLCTFRDNYLIRLQTGSYIVIGFIVGLIYYGIGNDAAKIMSNGALMFFMTMLLFFTNSMPTVYTFHLETAVFKREHENNWYSVPAFFISKLISLIPMQVVPPTLFVFICYYMTSQPPEYFRFFIFWLVCILFGIIGQTLGLLFGAIFPVQIGVFGLAAFTLPVIIFSGFFIRLNEIPSYMKIFSHISYFRYCFEGLLLAVYDYDRKPLSCSIPYCYFKHPTKFLEAMDVVPGNYVTDVLIIVATIIFYQILVFLALKYKVWKRR